MAIKGKKHDGRASDLTFSWMLTTLGPEWQQWQELAAEWLATQTVGIADKRAVLSRFFDVYLAECVPYAIGHLSLFFTAATGIVRLVKS